MFGIWRQVQKKEKIADIFMVLLRNWLRWLVIYKKGSKTRGTDTLKKKKDKNWVIGHLFWGHGTGRLWAGDWQRSHPHILTKFSEMSWELDPAVTGIKVRSGLTPKNHWSRRLEPLDCGVKWGEAWRLLWQQKMGAKWTQSRHQSSWMMGGYDEGQLHGISLKRRALA